MKNMIIGLGNTGSNIVNETINVASLKDVKKFTIDSVTSNLSIDNINEVTFIPIISDEKSGSGRNRERGKAMYKFHESQGAFDELYAEAIDSKAPVLVISSAAGGTGSGSIIPVCEALINNGVQVIPIIICPNMQDPDAYHLNANDLMLELSELGVETYAMFRNQKNDANYAPVNKEVVSLIEIVFGKKYDETTLDSIDDSDLDVILNTPGRFIAIDVTGDTVESTKKEITRKVLSGFQPGWTDNDAINHTFVTAYSLTSMFANTDFKTVFEEVNNRITNVYDEYRNISTIDNGGMMKATLIIAGLPPAEYKEINTEFKEVGMIGEGMNKSRRPKFINRKKANVTSQKGDNNSTVNKFTWN